MTGNVGITLNTRTHRSQSQANNTCLQLQPSRGRGRRITSSGIGWLHSESLSQIRTAIQSTPNFYRLDSTCIKPIQMPTPRFALLPCGAHPRHMGPAAMRDTVRLQWLISVPVSEGCGIDATGCIKHGFQWNGGGTAEKQTMLVVPSMVQGVRLCQNSEAAQPCGYVCAWHPEPSLNSLVSPLPIQQTKGWLSRMGHLIWGFPGGYLDNPPFCSSSSGPRSNTHP